MSAWLKVLLEASLLTPESSRYGGLTEWGKDGAKLADVPAPPASGDGDQKIGEESSDSLGEGGVMSDLGIPLQGGIGEKKSESRTDRTR